jgi:hypothetical protein
VFAEDRFYFPNHKKCKSIACCGLQIPFPIKKNNKRAWCDWRKCPCDTCDEIRTYPYRYFREWLKKLPNPSFSIEDNINDVSMNNASMNNTSMNNAIYFNRSQC